MLFIIFSFAFGIGLLAAFSALFDESTVALVICAVLMVALCIVGYIVCKKYINTYCINLAKNEHELYIQRAINNAIQKEKIDELKNALLEAGLIDEYKKIENKYENISQNIRNNDDFHDYCKLPPSD